VDHNDPLTTPLAPLKLVVTEPPIAMMFASPMDGTALLPPRRRLRVVPVRASLLGSGSIAGRLALLLLPLVFMPLVLASTSAAYVQDAGAVKPDQVFRVHPRTGKVSALTGTITENSLETVRLDRSGKESTYASSEIVRIVWGAVPPAFRDGITYAERGDHENAVARFRVAAGDSSSREVVRADARLRAAGALLAWGAKDANRFTECSAEAARFLSDYPNNRDVPQARWLKGRATRLAGDAAGAAADFRALYEEGANDPPTAGYPRALCLDAGLAAARAFLATGDTASARELFTALEGSFQQAASALEDTASAERVHLLAGAGEASVGEGFCLLAGGQASQAVRYFEGKLGRADQTASARFSASLGLAESHLAGGNLRQAQVEFAKVSSLDYTDRDRVARALVGMAEAAIKINDSSAKADAKLWLTKVGDVFGGTPSAAKAATILAKL